MDIWAGPFDVNKIGSEMYFFDSGAAEKEIVVFLHGLGATSQSWTFQYEPFRQHGYRCIAPDLPGFGESEFHGHRWNFHLVSAQIKALVANLGVERFHLLGISMGGAIALKMAFEAPELIDKLVLVNTFASLRPKSMNEWRYFVRRSYNVFTKSPRAQAELVAERIFPDEEKSDYRAILVEAIGNADPRVYRRAMLSIASFHKTRRLKRTQIAGAGCERGG